MKKDFEIDSNGFITKYKGSVHSVIIPCGQDGIKIKGIANSAFAYNNTISSVVIPKSIEKIGDKAFIHCENLEKIIFDENSLLKTIGIGAFSNTKIETIDIKSITPVLNVCEAAFKECSKLTNINFHKTNVNLNVNCFYGDLNIKNINMENALYLSSYAFFGCSKLSEIILPNVKKIGPFCFANCYCLEKIIINPFCDEVFYKTAFINTALQKKDIDDIINSLMFLALSQ